MRNKQISQRIMTGGGGVMSLPNSDMTFTSGRNSKNQNGPSGDSVPLNTCLMTQQFDENTMSTFDSAMISNLMASNSTVFNDKEIQNYSNQQKTLLAGLMNIPTYDEQATHNPLRQTLDKLSQLKLKTYVKFGCPPVKEIFSLQTECLHTYKHKAQKEMQ